jgi:inner membrane protein
MDSLTHIVLGAAIGEALLGKKIGKKVMVWGALAASLPDIDVFFTPFFHPVDGLLVHRGITHSFLFVLVMAPLLGWIFSRFNWERPVSTKNWTLLFFITLVSHLLLDCCTVYGTGIFEPFSNYRAQFTSLFIVEPFYTLPLLLGFIALLILSRKSPKRKFWVAFGLRLSTFYLALTICNKIYIDRIFTKSLLNQNIYCIDYITTPTPFNNILWNITAKDSSGFWTGYYSHFDKSENIKFTFIPRNDSLAGDLINNPVIQKLVRFSSGYYCFTKENGELHYNDLRFSFAGEFNADAKAFVFSYALKKDNSQPFGVNISRNSWQMSRFNGISKLIDRVKGV